MLFYILFLTFLFYSLQKYAIFYCYSNRLIVLGLAIGGVLLSYVAQDTCEFISFENQRGTPWENLEPPFDQAVSAHVGIFSFEILEAGNNGTTTGKCVDYDDRFADMIDFYEAIAAAQFCAIVAPSLALVAIALNLFEFFVCGFNGSFIFSSFLYVAAAGIQAGTFSMLAEPAIWYVSPICMFYPGMILLDHYFVLTFPCDSMMLALRTMPSKIVVQRRVPT